MGSLLDAVGALVIGGMFLVTMFTAQFNVRSIGSDSNMELTLIEMSEKVVDNVNSYLSKVGLGVVGTDKISVASPNSFEFKGKDNILDPTYTILVVQEAYDDAEKGYPFKIYRNGSLELGPFYLADSLRITYYDIDEVITYTRENIRSIKVEMEFTYDIYSSGVRNKKIRNKITFWKYFDNLYI